MKIGTPRELEAGEARVAMTPESIAALKKLGYECLIEAGAGAGAGFTDDAYREAGADVVESAQALWDAADVVAKVRPPTSDELALLVAGKGHETGQIVGTDVLHFDDVEVASQAVLALDGKI